MRRSRSIVLALFLAVGFVGMNGGLPAGVAESTPATVAAAAETLAVDAAPVAGVVDVVGGQYIPPSFVVLIYTYAIAYALAQFFLRTIL